MCFLGDWYSGNTVNTYSRYAWLLSRPATEYSDLAFFVVFLNPFGQVPGYNSIRPRPLPFKSFLIHLLSYYSKLYVLQTDNIVT
jgi:hypothetical protein